MTALDAARRAYAEELRAVAGIGSPRLVAAFATVPRERFLGPGPWPIAQPLDPEHPYRTTPDARPEQLYHDVVVAIDTARQLNNGQPSAHARWLDAAAPAPGDSVLHIGCATGYYTALLAELVGGGGRVLALEIDPELAARARACLADDWPQARVEVGDGGGDLRGPHQVIYVSAGATHPRREWLAALAQGGRMLLPLTVHVPRFPHGVGLVICAERRDPRWPVRVVSPVGIYDCAGARDEAAAAELRKLLVPGAAAEIRSLRVDTHARGEACLVHTEASCLSS
jgi:protein-L-isoaspartate(D-aspartate) O-methyltransferase